MPKSLHATRAAAALTVLFASASAAIAQIHVQQQVQIAGALPAGFDGGPAAATLEEMTPLLELRIDAIQRVAKLEDAQAAKLRLAAAAAAKEIFADPVKFGVPRGMVQVQIGGMGFGGGPAAPQGDAPSLSDEDAEAEEHGAELPGKPIDISMPVPLGVVLNHEIWTKTLDTVLTDKQQVAVDIYWKEREIAKRRSRVAQQVDSLDDQLILTPEQRDKVTAIIEKNLDAAPAMHAFIPAVGVGVNLQPVPVSVEDLTEILSPTQLSLFKKQKANEGNPFAGLGAIAPMVQQAVGGALPGAAAPTGALGLELDSDNDRPLVKSVTPNSLAATLGVKKGDVIVSVNDVEVASAKEAEEKLGAILGEMILNPGKAPSVVVERDGENVTLKLPQ